jgi:hypothetical protein
MWGNPDGLREVKSVVSLIEQLQQQQMQAQADAPAGTTDGGGDKTQT